MSVQRVFANVWSFISTLVRSFITLFSFRRRRASDPFSLNRTPEAALAHLRPIILTPRSIQRARSTRAPSTTSTQTSAPQTSSPQRTSPKLGPHDAELGLPDTPCEPAAASAASLRESTPDTSATGSLYVLPLTPPDRCYLPSASDCPYTEPWPTTVPLDHGKRRFSGSPLRVSINTDLAFPEPMVGPIGSPPPGRWSPVQIWTSTPCKKDNPVPDPASSSLDRKDASSALAIISHALISRSMCSVKPYDDASSPSMSSDASPFVALAEPRPGPMYERRRAQAHVPHSKNHPFPRFHHPDAYAYSWCRHGARLPGKSDRTPRYARSQSHSDLSAPQWYGADAYAASPVAALSPPQCDSATEGEDEDEDEMPLGRLRERLARRNITPSASVGAAIGLGVRGGASARKAAGMSPRTRRMSEGCLLAISASTSTPTRVGVGVRSVSMVIDDDGYGPKDWLEALSLRFSAEQKDALEPGIAVNLVV